MKQVIRYSHLEVLTQEAVDIFIKKIYAYKDKRIEIVEFSRKWKRDRMRVAIYIRVGNPDQVTIQPQKEVLMGQSRGVLGGGSKRAGCIGNDIPSLQEFLQEIRGYDRHNNLTLIHRQFCPN